MNLQRIIDAYSSPEIDSLTVRAAKLAFDTVFESIAENCLLHGIKTPDWDAAFGVWALGGSGGFQCDRCLATGLTKDELKENGCIDCENIDYDDLSENS